VSAPQAPDLARLPLKSMSTVLHVSLTSFFVFGQVSIILILNSRYYYYVLNILTPKNLKTELIHKPTWHHQWKFQTWPHVMGHSQHTGTPKILYKIVFEICVVSVYETKSHLDLDLIPMMSVLSKTWKKSQMRMLIPNATEKRMCITHPWSKHLFIFHCICC
jgi:hypothetical protein